MSTLLTNREMELFRVAIHWAMEYSDSNPEVGFGLSVEAVAERITKSLSFEIDEDDVAECCETITGS